MKYGLLDTTPERLTKSLNELQRKQQLDYVGSYNATDKVITFETNVDYALENNVEYEIDAILDLSGVIPDEATIVFKNNGDDIQVNNLLNYVTVDPITFGQMKQVMLPYDLEEGRYRWIFDATYNLATGPLPWIVGTDWTYGSGFENNTSENIGFVLGQQYSFNVTLTFDRQEVDLPPMPVTVIGTAVPFDEAIGVSISATIPVEYDGRTKEFKFDLLAEDGVMFVDGIYNPVFNPAYSTAIILLGERLAGATITGMSGRRLNDVRVFNMPATVVQDRKDVVQIVTNAEMLDAVTNQLWEGSLIVTPSDDDGYTLGANYQWNASTTAWVELTSPQTTLKQKEVISIAIADWVADSTIDPFTVKADKTLTTTINTNDEVSLVDVNVITQAETGLVIASISGQVITFYAMTIPEDVVSFNVIVEG